jgi:glutamate synthase domain-containing protein 3
VRDPDPILNDALDHQIIADAAPALEQGRPTTLRYTIRNQQRAVGALLSSRIARRHGQNGLPPGTLELFFEGASGQSFGAWLASGVEMTLLGEGNDYVGKGLSGGVLAVRPSPEASFVPEENVIVGNTVLYGATSGRAFFSGLAGERFAVRNSGASAVVEGVGDHGCEYMTGGVVVVLGPTGHNFAAGMSGGIAYVYDADAQLGERCNFELVDLETLTAEDITLAQGLVSEHQRRTGSPLAARLLADWERACRSFIKVLPRAYKQALAELAAQAGGSKSPVAPASEPVRVAAAALKVSA